MRTTPSGWRCPRTWSRACPTALPLDKAAFATLGAIALQGLRVAAPTLGEVAAVIGLGLIGQLAVQLLRANGCRVLGIDLDATRIKQALEPGRRLGRAPGRRPRRLDARRDRAATAPTSRSSRPRQRELGAAAARRGAVPHEGPRRRRSGATAMDLDRRTLLREGARAAHEHVVRPRPLRPPLRGGRPRLPDRVRALDREPQPPGLPRARRLGRDRSGPARRRRPSTSPTPRRPTRTLARGPAARPRGGLPLRRDAAAPARTLALPARAAKRDGEVGVAFVGAGNYAKAVLLPALAARVRRERRAGSSPPPGRRRARSAEKFGFAHCGTDPAQRASTIPTVDLVFVATQHDSHAALAEAALRAGKAVWLEKPAALDEAQLESLARAVARDGRLPHASATTAASRSHARAIREAFARARGPMAIHVHRRGRADAARHLARRSRRRRRAHRRRGVPHGRPVQLPRRRAARPACSRARSAAIRSATTRRVLVLGFADGSTATIAYLANASPELPKERFEVSADGRTAACDNFRETRLPGGAQAPHAQPGQGPVGGGEGRGRGGAQRRARRRSRSTSSSRCRARRCAPPTRPRAGPRCAWSPASAPRSREIPRRRRCGVS